MAHVYRRDFTKDCGLIGTSKSHNHELHRIPESVNAGIYASRVTSFFLWSAFVFVVLPYDVMLNFFIRSIFVPLALVVLFVHVADFSILIDVLPHQVHQRNRLHVDRIDTRLVVGLLGPHPHLDVVQRMFVDVKDTGGRNLGTHGVHL